MKKINLSNIVLIATIILFSCSSNEDSNGDSNENPVISVPKKDFINEIVASNDLNPKVTIKFNAIENVTIKNYKITTELNEIDTSETSLDLNSASDFYLGNNTVKVIATNTSEVEVAFDEIDYNHQILKKHIGSRAREIVIEKNDDGDIRYLITGNLSIYTNIKVEINNQFVSNNKTGKIDTSLFIKDAQNKIKMTFSYGANGVQKTFDNLYFRVKI